jgi:hypothetical protein
MQNLKVLAIGSVQPAPVAAQATEGKGKDSTDRAAATTGLITFAVDRQEALVLKALKDNERVKMEMVLRGAGDDQPVVTDPVTLSTIVERYQFRLVATPVVRR